MHQRHFLFAVFFALFLCVWGLGCGPTAQEKEEQRQKLIKMHKDDQDSYAKFVSDDKALMPDWFRARYPQWQDGPEAHPEADALNPWYGAPVGSYINPLLLTISLVGLVFYPVWALLGCLWFCKMTDTDPNYLDPPVPVVVVGVAIACYVANIILSWLLYGLIYLGLSLFSQADYYVPWAFISYCLHAVVHLTGLAVLATLGLRAIVRAFWTSQMAASQQQQPANNVAAASQAPSPKRTPRQRVQSAIRAVVKSLLVAILTGVGSEVGGWIGALLVFITASGVAAFFGFTTPSSSHR